MPERVDFLDHLRAIAVSMVVVAHYRTPVLPGGGLGVYIFFPLSGYLICKMVLDRSAYSPLTAIQLILRRLIRIFPPYVISVLLVCVLAAIWRPEDFNKILHVLPGLLTFTYFPTYWINLGVGVFWSLHVEFWFYVCLPLVALMVGRGRTFMIAIAILAAMSLFAAMVWSLTRPDILRIPSPVLAFLSFASLLYGSAVAILKHTGRLDMPRPFAYFMLTAGIIALLLLARFASPDSPLGWLLATNAAGAITAGMIAAYLAQPISVNIPMSAAYGRISYSVYLLHAVPYGYDFITWPQNGKSFVLFPLVIGASVIMYRMIELPSADLARRMTTTSSKVPLPALS